MRYWSNTKFVLFTRTIPGDSCIAVNIKNLAGNLKPYDELLENSTVLSEFSREVGVGTIVFHYHYFIHLGIVQVCIIFPCLLFKMDYEDLAIWYLLKKSEKKKRRQNREYWVHLIVTLREEEGAFPTLICHLPKYPAKFFKYFRMSMDTFDELLNAIESSIVMQDTVMRSSISPRERLALTLRYAYIYILY